MAVYSLTGNDSSPFHAEPEQCRRLPGSSSRRFNGPSRVARKGNGKNLATRGGLFWQSLFVHRLPTYRRSPSVGNTRWETTKHRYGSPINTFTTVGNNKSCQDASSEHRAQSESGFPFLDFRRIVFVEILRPLAREKIAPPWLDSITRLRCLWLASTQVEPLRLVR
jgi:hypothetical protein